MKISLSLLAFASASFKGPEITRSVSGEWVDKYIAAGRHRRQSERSDFSAIAAMIAYLQGEGADNVDPSTQNMEATLADIEKKYTNYGCYCWRNGAHKITAFSAGSGNVDWNDRACTRLYQCYNCIKNDYGSTYHEISYQAVFKTDAEGNRVIECADNAKSDGENVCRCDAAFAEAIKFNQDQCDNDAEDKGGKAYCINEEYRTANGGGDYVCPLTLKDDTGMKHDALPRDKCCGIYPNRIPYNPAGTDCCEERDEAADNVFNYKIKKQGICQENGGTVVVSQEGNPHSYIPTL